MNPLSNPFYLLPPLIAAALNCVLIALVLSKTRRDFGDWLFCGVLASLGLTSLFIFAMRSSSTTEQALFWERALALSVPAPFVLYYHFTRIYTNVIQQKSILILAYFFLGGVALLTPTDLLVTGMRVESYGYAPIMGLLSSPLFSVVLVLIGGGIYNLVKRYKASVSYAERNRLLYLIIAAFFPPLGLLLDGFTTLPPLAIWCYIAFCGVCTIAIVRYQLLDIRVVIRKGIAYLLMSAAVALPYVGIIFTISQLLRIQTIPIWVYLTLLIILALALQSLWSQVQRRVDKWFYRDRYDHLAALKDFSRETHKISDTKELGSSLTKLIHQALHSIDAYLLLPSDSGDFTTVSSAGETVPELNLNSHSLILQWFKSNKSLLRRQDLDIIPQLQPLTAKEMSQLEETHAALFVPVLTRQDKLVGLIILAKKLSDRPYSKEDEQLIETVASRMAVELENVRLYAVERAAHRELQKQDRRKTEFLHSVAHELKTPLTAIISSSQLLDEELSVAGNLRERLVKNIQKSASSMDRRVTELLNFAKMQGGELQIEAKPVEISQTIVETSSQLGILFQNKVQILRLDMPDSLPRVSADQEKLEQVLFNLLSNANKFSPSGSDITLRVREADGRIIVEVEDSAPALTEEERRKLFEPYYRGEDVEERERVPGLGLGLTISKKLVELHHGEIWVESEPGKGNTFAFSLPALQQGEKGNG